VSKAQRDIKIEHSAQAAARTATQIFKEITTKAIERRGVCHISLAGGTTPRRLYELLAETSTTDEVPWSRTEVFFGDERDVPLDDVDSNYHMVQRTLLDNAPVDWSRVHAMRADAEDIDAAAEEYEATIRHLLPPDDEGIPQFDLMLLGLGGDGHTASLFPGCEETLNETEKLVTSCYVPVLGRRRMTITFPVINASRQVLMLITGNDKAEIVKRLFGEGDESLPAGRVTPRHGNMTVVLDADAARLL
jgi:6-phosphogluconolactonase